MHEKNGVGYELMVRFFLNGESWYCLTTSEQHSLAITIRDFSRRLREAGFIEGKG